MSLKRESNIKAIKSNLKKFCFTQKRIFEVLCDCLPYQLPSIIFSPVISISTFIPTMSRKYSSQLVGEKKGSYIHTHTNTNFLSSSSPHLSKIQKAITRGFKISRLKQNDSRSIWKVKTFTNLENTTHMIYKHLHWIQKYWKSIVENIRPQTSPPSEQ